MRILILSLSILLFSQFSWSGPGDGPIVPWPTSKPPHRVISKDVIGSFYGFTDNAIWYIDITSNPDLPRSLNIAVYSHSLFNNMGVGYLQAFDNLYWGYIKMDETHSAGIVIYRNDDGLQVRLVEQGKDINEFHVYRSKADTHD